MIPPTTLASSVYTPALLSGFEAPTQVVMPLSLRLHYQEATDQPQLPFFYNKMTSAARLRGPQALLASSPGSLAPQSGHSWPGPGLRTVGSPGPAHGPLLRTRKAGVADGWLPDL